MTLGHCHAVDCATPRVEACIAEVARRYNGESKAAQARYFEEVHQHIAPLARTLERELAQAKAEAAAAWAQLHDFKSRKDVAAATAPEGYVLVPKVPTEAMHVAAVRTLIKCTGNDDFPPAVWAAMVNAAPQRRGQTTEGR